MGIWLVILAVWAACLAADAVHGVSVPWLVTVGCWAAVDLAWRRLARMNAPVAGAGAPPIRSRILAPVPHLLYCLPLGNVPILGLRLLPPLPAMQWAGAGMCVTRVGFTIYARRVLAKNWTGDVTLTPAHVLVQDGPYALVRHPIYLGFLLAQLGMIVALGEVRALLFVFGIERLLRKLPLEEAMLRKEYPMEYEQYSRRVRKLVPFVW